MKVTITYLGVVEDIVRNGSQVCSTFAPTGSYVDSEGYAGSVYDTNVPGWGKLEGIAPMEHTPVRFAKFEQAILAAKTAAENGTENTGITFDIGDDYKEELYWTQMANGLKEQFTITVAAGDAA